MTAAPHEADMYWKRILDRAPDDRFVYAVTTTGVYCRAGCPSRRPQRAHVRFFADGIQARQAGFRACLRCLPDGPGPDARLASRVAAFLVAHLDRRVTLKELAAQLGCSPFTVQRVFTRVMGMSPSAYANARRAEGFRSALQAGGRVTDAVYAAGFSAPSRARHAALLGMLPKTYKQRGRGERIGYVIDAAPLGPLGRMLVAATERGVCAVLLGDTRGELIAELQERFPAATLHEDAALLEQWRRVSESCRESHAAAALPMDLRGTAFQARVWAALQAIPRGETRSYAQLAAEIGSPTAVRAVASACARNPAAVIIPCHRVVGSDGKLTGYRWGLQRKRALLKAEQDVELSQH
jgi:AraC family transcriptional regulator of adaptative response/methylated-DNA-[protein]-cysteine methyltransferase